MHAYIVEACCVRCMLHRGRGVRWRACRRTCGGALRRSYVCDCTRAMRRRANHSCVQVLYYAIQAWLALVLRARARTGLFASPWAPTRCAAEAHRGRLVKLNAAPHATVRLQRCSPGGTLALRHAPCCICGECMYLAPRRRRPLAGLSVPLAESLAASPLLPQLFSPPRGAISG